jgi:hypothetical protein
MTKCTALIALALVAVLGTVACGSDQSPTAPRVEYDIDTPLLAAGKMPKIDICHLDDDGVFNLINVNGNAERAHLGHGDVFPDIVDDVKVCPSAGCSVLLSDAGGTGDVFSATVTLDWTASGEQGAVTYVIYSLPGGEGSEPAPANEVDRFTASGEDSFVRTFSGFPGWYLITVECPEGTVVDQVELFAQVVLPSFPPF